MNQEIGITFTTRGIKTVEGDIDRLGRIVDGLHGKIVQLKYSFNSIGRATDTMKGKISGVAGSVREVGTEVKAAKQHIEGLKKEINSINRIKPPKVVDGRYPNQQGRSGATAFGLIAGYKLYTAALEGAKYGLVDIGMGRSRAEFDTSLGKLSGIGFDQVSKYNAETASARFASKYGHTSQKEYIEGLTYTASSFGSGVGMSNILKMNENAILMGKAGQMGTEEAAKFQNKLINQMITALPAADYERLMHGGRANIRGMGGWNAKTGKHMSANMNLGELSEKLMAMAFQSHAVSGIYGKDTMSFMSQFGPIGQALGMAPSTSLALAGLLYDSGFHPGRSGRGMKQLMLGLPGALARSDMLSEGKLYDKNDPNLKSAAKKLEKREIDKRAAAIRREMGADFWGAMTKHVQSMAVAVATSKGRGIDMVKDLGFSQDFLPIFMSLLKHGAIARGQTQDRSISRADSDDVRRKYAEQVDSVGANWNKLVAASERLTKALSQSSGELSAFTKGLTWATNKVAEKFERENAVKMMHDFLGKKHVESGWGVKLKPGQERWGENKDRDVINKWARAEYDSRIESIGKRPKDDDPRSMIWDAKKGSIKRDVQRSVDEMWSNSQQKLNASDVISALNLFAPSVGKAVSALDMFTDALRPKDKTKPDNVMPSHTDNKRPGGEDAARAFHDGGGSAAPSGGQTSTPSTLNANIFLDGHPIKQLVIELLDEMAQNRGDRYGNNPSH